MATRQASSKTPSRAAVKATGVCTPLYRGGTTHPVAGLQENQKLQKLLTGAAELSPAEKKELLARLSLDVQSEGKSKANSATARDLDLWSVAVQETLSKALGDTPGASLGVEVIKRALRDADAVDPVMKLMTRAKLDGKTPAERLVMFRYLAGLLVSRARRVANFTEAPLTPKLVANNGQHIAAIFDAAFPGYLAAGLAGIVAAQLIKVSDRDC